MKKITRYIIVLFLTLFIGKIGVSAADFTCNIGGYDVKYNSSGRIVAVYKNGSRSSTYNGKNVRYYSAIYPKSAKECPTSTTVQLMTSHADDGKYEFRIIVNNESTTNVRNCAEFRKPEKCKAGTTGSGKFGCAWNEKHKFCSPTGLTYLTCGSGKFDAHDIPEMVPKLMSYFITILKTVTPIVLIIMSMVQIIKAIANSNEDEIKKAKSSLIKKLIAAALVFFSISIVQFVVDQVADDGESGSVAACMNCFINNQCNDSFYYTDGYGKCYFLSNRYTEVDCNTDIGVTSNNQFLNN